MHRILMVIAWFVLGAGPVMAHGDESYPGPHSAAATATNGCLEAVRPPGSMGRWGILRTPVHSICTWSIAFI